MHSYKIVFNKLNLVNKELDYLKDAIHEGKLSGDGKYTKLCHQWIESTLQCQKVLLTHSCTAALEMMAILTNFNQGDEIIMPSFTFVSTANAFVLRGAVPVFVDIRSDTKNIDEDKIEQAITSRTKAIMCVHYAGVGCEMDKILKLAKKYNLIVLEDAAQGVLAEYKNQYLGTMGDLSAVSFHETKNIVSGEGGALLVNKSKYIERAEIIREKGTDRSKFLRGQVDKYTWVDLGSSYLPSELVSSVLYSQLENGMQITKKRLEIWNTYHSLLQPLEVEGFFQRPIVPSYCNHNGHIYYILVNSLDTRTKLIEYLANKKILSVFHYVPLHSSPAGKRYGRVHGSMDITNSVSDRLIRLPLHYDLTEKDILYITDKLRRYYKN